MKKRNEQLKNQLPLPFDPLTRGITAARLAAMRQQRTRMPVPLADRSRLLRIARADEPQWWLDDANDTPDDVEAIDG